MTPVPGLARRRILLTGASSGVGLAAAHLLAAEGARLVLLSRSEEALEEVRRSVGPAVEGIVPADVSQRDEVNAAVQTASELLGGLDVVISNAAAASFGHFAETPADDFDRTVAVTFTGSVNVVRAALPHLRATRGTLVQTCSLNAAVPLPGWSSYASSKHALRGFLGTLRVEEREQRSGVRICMLHPGPIDTPLFAQATSATGRSPRVPPDSYSAATVAEGLVRLAKHPRDEITLGGTTMAIRTLFELSRPAADTVMMMIDRWYRSGDAPAPQPGSLWQAPKGSQLSGEIPTRGTVLGSLALRKLPEASTPLKLARNLAIAGTRAAQLGTKLLKPTPEQPMPRESPREHPEPREHTRRHSQV